MDFERIQYGYCVMVKDDECKSIEIFSEFSHGCLSKKLNQYLKLVRI